MAIEIERRFLVITDGWRPHVLHASRYRQAYLVRIGGASVRVRREARGASVTIKGRRRGIVRDEFTYAVPLAEADEMMARLAIGPVVEKVRHFVAHDGAIWHVDVYAGAALGVVTAEIELSRPDEGFSRPPWIGAEVTHDPRYSNLTLARGEGAAAPRRPAGLPPAPLGPATDAAALAPPP